jgi:two-component system cell cycle response regulator DivK
VGQKILVVEDNELNLKLFCDLLRAHSYEAEPVRDGREALERARAFAPDLVVMDIQMPHISGLELIEQMKADSELRATPIMAVTAYAARGDEERIRDAGAEGYVSKPISVVRFVEAVAGLLEAAARRAAEAKPVAEEEIAAEEAPEAADETATGEPEAETGEPDPNRHSRESGNPPSDSGGDGEPEEEAKDVDASRHSGEGRNPPSEGGGDGEAGEEEKMDPGSSPG